MSVGTDFAVFSNPYLTGLASFTNLTSVRGQLQVNDNAGSAATTFDRDGALPALQCIGSYHWQAAYNQVPSQSLNLPVCS